ncbi:MAG: 2Fe-2S iron-sulfur cluster-binding protein, partial [Flavobacteriaceae bacterium]|nr:2Fe-2S iron-sulfur cluster-binding protein [Flavobacteriaceae bacterium]
MKAFINNKAYELKPGETILEFTRRVQNYEAIPTMCQDDRLENFGSCRVCSVEVAREQDGPTRVVASCHTPAFDGMYVYHQTEKIQRLRQNIVELVLTNYPEDKIHPPAYKKPTPF